VNKLIIIVISLVFLNHCSLNENSRIWKDKDQKIDNPKNVKKIFSEEKKITIELNQELKLDFSKSKTNNKIVDNKNDYGFQNYSGLINKVGNYKFSKFDDINQLNFKTIFLNDGLIFFDKKGSIYRYIN
jgi:hypothetical protein